MTAGMRRPLDGFAIGTMFVLCTIWGIQQVTIKIAAADVAPVTQVAIRTGLSAVLLALLVVARGQRRAFRGGTWGAGIVVAALFGIEFVFIGEGLRLNTASRMVVFLYTAPVFTALGLHLLVPSERLSRGQWLGVAIAFAGIGVAFSREGGAGGSLAGDALGVLAGAAWGATTVLVRATRLAEAPATQTLLWQLAGGFAVLAAYAVASGQSARVVLTPTAVAVLLFQGVVVSFASYLTWFWMLRRYLATRLSVISFLTPLLGVGFGAWILREPVGPRFALGAALVLAGVTGVSGASAFRSRAPGR